MNAHNTSTPASVRPTVREVVFDLLRELKMTTIFGNPGSTELPFLSGWPADLRYVLALQEASVVAMADGYAQATNRATFVNVHSAAGLGNGLGALFTAFRNHTPLVVTAGQQARSLLPYDPYLGADRAIEFPRPYVKWACEPARAEDVPAAILQAHTIAMQRPRGPTFVSIPMDDWSAPAAPVRARDQSWEIVAEQPGLLELVQAIRASTRPALVVGAGVDRDDAFDLAVVLAERMNAPAWQAPVTSRVSFPTDHPLFAGFLPAIPEGLSDALKPYDLVLVVGAPVFTFHVAGASAILEDGAPIFQITDDAGSAARSRAHRSILGSIQPTLKALVDLLSASSRLKPSVRRELPPPAAGVPISPDFAIQEIARAMGPETIVVEEAPSHRPAIERRLPIRRSGGFYTMASGGLGWGLPAAVGIALAKERRVLCLIGDGSAMYSVQALWTASQNKVPLTVVVLNNECYGAMLSFTKRMGKHEPPGVHLPGISFEGLASALGVPHASVASPDRIHPVLTDMFAADGPGLVNIKIDPEAGDIY